MTPNTERDERVSEDEIRCSCGQPVSKAAIDAVLAKRKVAVDGGPNYRHGPKLGDTPIGRAIANDAATRMRDLCVAKVREMAQQWYREAKKRGAAFSDKGRLAETIATELESLTLEQGE